LPCSCRVPPCSLLSTVDTSLIKELGSIRGSSAPASGPRPEP
jgi:hypothetical protein